MMVGVCLVKMQCLRQSRRQGEKRTNAQYGEKPPCHDDTIQIVLGALAVVDQLYPGLHMQTSCI